MVQPAKLVGTATLQFKPEYELPNKSLADSLSAVLWLPDGSLFVAADETVTLEQLTLSSPTNVLPIHFEHHQQLALEKVLKDFQGTDKKGKTQEIDLEGLTYAEPYLWFVGSHSTKRKKPNVQSVDLLQDPDDLERLTRVERELNRYMLGRVRLRQDDAGRFQFPDTESLSPAEANYLKRTDGGNLLMDALQDDPHLASILNTQTTQGRSIAYPGKDNGFDIEGIVVQGNRIFLGLRGPVLRGWSILLELAIEEAATGFLKLREIGPNGERYRKHFLDLKGLGIRDLCIQGEDLLILAGPTLNLDGPVYIFALKGGLGLFQNSNDRANKTVLQILCEVPVGQGEDAGKDHPEGITLVPQPNGTQILVVYDAPAAARKSAGEQVAIADIFAL